MVSPTEDPGAGAAASRGPWEDPGAGSPSSVRPLERRSKTRYQKGVGSCPGLQERGHRGRSLPRRRGAAPRAWGEKKARSGGCRPLSVPWAPWTAWPPRLVPPATPGSGAVVSAPRQEAPEPLPRPWGPQAATAHRTSSKRITVTAKCNPQERPNGLPPPAPRQPWTSGKQSFRKPNFHV